MSKKALKIDIHEVDLPSRKEVKTEVWFRDPVNYIRQVRDHASAYYTTWNEAYVNKINLSPQAFLNLNLGVNSGWKALVLNTYREIGVLYEAGERQHTAVYPLWNASYYSTSLLVEMIRKQRDGSFIHQDFSVPVRPMPGQRKRIIISGMGGLVTNYWRGVALQLSYIQEQNPDVDLMLTGSFSYPMMFGKAFRTVDADPAKTAVSAGEVSLPCGAILKANDKELAKNSYWLEVLGYDWKSIQKNYDMVCFNVNSLEWASRYYKTLDKHAPKGRGRGYNRMVESIDWRSPEAKDFLQSSNLIYSGRSAAKDTDKIVCSSCTLWAACKYYRDGGVCAVPDSEMTEVSKMFGSRDADKIIDAMAALVALNTERIERGMSNERESDKLDPEVTKVINSTISNAEKLAKLRNPELAAGAKTNVVINNQQNAITHGSNIAPAIAATIIERLELEGYDREEITDDLVQNYLTRMALESRSAGGRVIAGELDV